MNKNNDISANSEMNINKPFDLKKNILRALQYWYYIPIFLLISIALSIYNYKTTTPLFKVSAKILISGGDNNNSRSSIGSEESAFSGVSLGTQNNVENQLIILTSTKQIEKTLKQLDFSVSYYRKGILQTFEVYTSSPFKVIPDTSKTRLPNGTFCIEFINQNEFYLTIENNKNYKRKGNFFEKITEPGFSFTIQPAEKKLTPRVYVNNTYCFRFNNLNRLVRIYKNKINIQQIGRSSIYEISITENNVQKGFDFLNKLAENSVAYTLDKKNQIANNTIRFIDNQLIGVSDSLANAKKVLENFRSRNEVMDVSMQGQMIIQQSQNLENERHTIAQQFDYYKYLLDYVQNNRDNTEDLTPPSSQNVTDQILSGLIADLSDLNAEKASLLFNSSSENPRVTQINRRIKTVKNSIIENTKNLIKTTERRLKDIDDRLMKLSYQIRKLPKTEQALADIQKRFQKSDEIHSHLLERRYNAELAKAANMPDNEIIEQAYPAGQVKPDIMKSAFIVILLGLFIPSGIIFLKVYFNEKIQDKDDLDGINIPIVGTIPSQKNKGLEILNNPRSAIAEAIRSVRTSLEFYPTPNGNKTILITSSIPGEGKSFIAANLAISYAQLGKRTIMLELDMRKPALYKILDIKPSGKTGLSRFLLNSSDTNNSGLIERTHIDNLDIIFAGEIPPNPVELIAGEKTKMLFDQLKQLYDIIILDTPPVGLVTDAIILSAYADTNIIITRHNVTPLKTIHEILEDNNIKGMNNISFLINALPIKKHGYSYRYGYGVKSDYYKTN